MQGVESLPDTEDWLWLDEKGGFCGEVWPTRDGCTDLSAAGANACDWPGCG